MTLTATLLTTLPVILSPFVMVWAYSVVRRNVAVVDVFWGMGFVVACCAALALGGNWSSESVMIAVLVSVWAARLSGYLAWRNWGKPEDHRYAAMRRRHGARFALVSLFTVFGLQALLVWIVSLPVQVGVVRPRPWDMLTVAGWALWITGLFFEAVGDYQLARFKADPSNRGKVMDRGLWRYTRHPNYFGDFLVWWGLYLVAAEHATWWWTVVGPVVMSALLIRVSGVRLLEHSLRDRVAGYERYVRETSAFFPLPPRK